MRVRALSTLLVAAFIAATSPLLAGTAAASAPADWSTSPRVVHRSPTTGAEVTGVRVAHHRRFERVVIDIRGGAPGFAVRYVRRLHADPSGKAVNLLGPASLRIVLNPANGHDINTGDSTLTTAARTKWRLDQVRETAVIGDFEAVFSVGVGLAHKSQFRVLTLHNPTRILVDVRH
jgi:hypothetical protein